MKKINIGKWKQLNDDIGDAMMSFDFETIKALRIKQREIEDSVYTLLRANVETSLPDNCGELEVGYDTILRRLVYVELSDDIATAYFIDKNGNVEIIKNFNIGDDD